MAERALAEIIATEEQARQIIENACGEAAATVRRAEDEASAAISAFAERQTRNAAEKKRLSLEKAAADSEKFAHDTERQCAEIRQKLLGRKEDAIKAVMEAVLS